MPTAFVAGLGLEFYGAFRRYEPVVENWRVRVVPSRRRPSDLGSCMPELEAILASDTANAEGAHIVAFHSFRSEKEGLKARLTPTVRLIWSGQEHAAMFGRHEFDQVLSALLAIEEVWRNEVRPPDVRSALLLPRNIFEAIPPFNEIWGRAIDSRTAGEIGDTRERVRRFHEKYYDKGRYTDRNSLEFLPPKPTKWHGFHVPWNQRHKYTFRIPEGFHYDVKHCDEARFSLTSTNEGPRSFVEYANVDPYGCTRGGH
jgi:hypothetical protein